jgi:hypothetical protein
MNAKNSILSQKIAWAFLKVAEMEIFAKTAHTYANNAERRYAECCI